MTTLHPPHLTSPRADFRTVPLTPANLRHAKAAYSVRRVPKDAMCTLLMGDLRPRSGDLVLAEIVRLGQHRRIELGNGRRAHLHPGDRVILCYGNRYAPDQFEAYVPEHLGPCQMVAAGGIAARQHSKHNAIKDATEILPLGLLGDERGRPMNLAGWALPVKKASACPLTLAVLGTAMNAGKSTTAAHLIRGLSGAGLKVGAAKITGTGAGGDVWLMQDHGADPVLDFTDAGYASTFRLPPETLECIAVTLCACLVEAGADVLVLEIADGLLQSETAALLTSPWFRQQVDGILFAAADALGAKAGVEMVRQQKLPLAAVSGALTASPLASAEAARVVSYPVLGKAELTSETVLEILGFTETPRLRIAR